MTYSENDASGNEKVLCPDCGTAIPLQRWTRDMVLSCPECNVDFEIAGENSPRARLLPRPPAAEYRRLCRIPDLPAGTRKVYRLNNREIVAFRIGNQFYALKNRCPHQGVELSDGTLENGSIRCPGHGFRFELKTGFCDRVHDLKVSTFEVSVRGQELWIRL